MARSAQPSKSCDSGLVYVAAPFADESLAHECVAVDDALDLQIEDNSMRTCDETTTETGSSGD